MPGKKTLVLGASEKANRYSNIAVRKLIAYNHPVIAIGKRAGKIEQTEIITEKVQYDDIDTVTLYLSPENQIPYYNYILSLNPKRIIFNPGTENEDLETMAREKGIKTLEACTLVMLSTAQY